MKHKEHKKSEGWARYHFDGQNAAWSQHHHNFKDGWRAHEPRVVGTRPRGGCERFIRGEEGIHKGNRIEIDEEWCVGSTPTMTAAVAGWYRVLPVNQGE